jgi:glutathione reductase (NADPH)
MSSYDYDLFVIGAGSGGVRAARFSAGFGARVAVAEERDLGGTCVNVGCIPKKLLVYASHFREELADARAGYGWTVDEPSFDWKTLIANKDREIERLNGIYGSLLENSGCDLVRGRARLVDAHTVAVGDRQYTADSILIAVGGWPTLPRGIEGIEHAISSNEMFHLDEMPRRIVIVGGGYIAVEFACVLHNLGCEVVQVYRGPLFLRGFDADVRAHLAKEMRNKGIDLRFEANPKRIEKTPAGIRAHLDDGSVVEADQLLCATGRHPLTQDLGLDQVGVELDRDGAIEVDDESRTSVPNIFAVGDVTNRINLTPVAIHEGACVARLLFSDGETKPDHRDVPHAVFSQPPIGCVGLSESQAEVVCDKVDVYRSEFRALKHTLTGGEERTLMKLVVDRDTDRVLGLHMVGPDAGEIVQGFAVAIKAGATKADFDATVGIHPTAAEEFVTMREAVGSPD